MQGINPSRTNAASVKGPETTPGFKILAPNVNGALTRIAVDGSLILMQPLVANSSPSVGVASSYSRAGKLQWTTNVPTDLFGLRDIAVSHFGTVYVTPSATLSNLIALDANSGQQLWTQTNNTSNRSHPLAVGSDGTIYFTSGAGPLQGKISAVNPDGSLKWQIIGPESNIALSTDESSLYVLATKGIAVPTGDVRRYSTVDGSFIANTPCDPRGDVYAFAPWNVLYTGNGSNDLLAFPPDIQSCSVISADGMFAVGIASTTTTGRIITVNNDGTLGGLDQLGNLLWKSAEPLSQAFSSSDAVIYAVAPATNDLEALDSEHGTVLWRQHFTDPITGQFLADDGNIYLTAGTNLFVSTTAPALGTISVSTNNAAATFTITGPVAYSGNGTSFIQANAAVGTYTISYGAVFGYVSPPSTTLTLTTGGTIAFTGNYSLLVPPPTLQQISPQSGFQGQLLVPFTVRGGNFDSGATLSFGGSGIQVLSYESRSVSQIAAIVQIDLTATAGARDVIVANSDLQVGTAAAAFLVRPTDRFLAFPLRNKNPFNAAINTVFDHSSTLQYCPDGVVTAYDGEEGRAEFGVSQFFVAFRSCNGDKQKERLHGYKNNNKNAPNFSLGGQYFGGGDRRFLFYDGHPGYDYRTTDQRLDGTLCPGGTACSNGHTEVLAAADGNIVCAKISGCPEGPGEIKIDHGNGYVTIYLHLSKFVLTSGPVKRGYVIGISGETGAPNNPHLHFEVRLQPQNAPGIPVDPYGWFPVTPIPDPYMRALNLRLWQ
jgi:hypothetical protein